MSFRVFDRRVAYHIPDAHVAVKALAVDDALDLILPDFVATGDVGVALALTTKREIQRLAQKLADQKAAILETYQLVSDAVALHVPDDGAAVRRSNANRIDGALVTQLLAALDARTDDESQEGDSFVELAQLSRLATNSLSPEQALLQREFDAEVMSNTDRTAELGEALQDAFESSRGVDWELRFSFRGSKPLTVGDSLPIFRELLSLDGLESSLRFVTDPAAIGEIDFALVEQFLSAFDRHALRRVGELRDVLASNSLIDTSATVAQLTVVGARRLARRVLVQLVGKTWSPNPGRRGRQLSGRGHERNDDVVAYVDDSQYLDFAVVPTMFGAVSRSATADHTPVDNLSTSRNRVQLAVSPDDWRVFDHDVTSSTATVLLVDVSLSMSIAGTFVAAKTLAIALQSLIADRRPRDTLDVVAFGLHAHRVAPHELATMACDQRYGTNMAEALELARRLLSRHQGARQILLVTDGEPTAYTPPGAEQPEFSYPPVPEVLAATMAQVAHCTREQIEITSFVLDADPGLVEFVRTLSARNGGRVVVVDPSNLAERVVKAAPAHHGA